MEDTGERRKMSKREGFALSGIVAAIVAATSAFGVTLNSGGTVDTMSERVKALEVRQEGIRDDVREIKRDVKDILKATKE